MEGTRVRGSGDSSSVDAETIDLDSSGGAPRDTPGASISRYVVLEEVGRGGMGRVLRGYDPKLQREVALKEVRRDALDEAATQRLVSEARAMAKLSHPNVVAVYDVEALLSGQVVLVMEYVAGQTLRARLRDGGRAWREVVGLFVAAGRGLAAAHEAGLLHRDFKPANVLVAEPSATSDDAAEDAPRGAPRDEGWGVVKVTDFGLAKGTGADTGASVSGQAASVDEGLTQAGTVVGTPRYMAPEQHFGQPLDARADQYAFCVSLWEALCGDAPFSGKTMAQQKRTGPPSWPESSVPRPIADAIVRGLSPDPERRWPSMRVLLDALSWDPARRRRRVAVVAGVVGVAGVLGFTAWSWSRDRAARCSGARQQLAGVWDDARADEVRDAILGIGKSFATGVWTRVEGDLDRYADQWAAMHVDACEATAVRGEQSAEVMDLRMTCLHRAAVDLDAIVTQLANADAAVAWNAHALLGQLLPLARCADAGALRQRIEPPLPGQADAVELARSRLAEATAAGAAGRYTQAKQAVDAARAAVEGVDYGPIRTELAVAQGVALHALGDYEAADRTLAESIELAGRWGQYAEMARAATLLMDIVGSELRRMDEGLRYASLAKGLVAGDPLREANVLNNLANILETRGDFEEAEAIQRQALALRIEVLGEDDPGISVSLNNIANILESQGAYEAAEAEHRRALALRERALGPDHPETAISINNLGNVLYSQGEYDDAETQYRRALAVREASLGPDHPQVAGSRTNIGNVLAAQGRHAEAETEYRRAIASWEESLGPDHALIASSRNNLAIVLQAQGRLADAETEHRRALAQHEATFGPDHPDAAMSRYNLATVLEAQGRYAEAEAEHRRALARREAALGTEHPDVAGSRNNLAMVLAKQGRAAEAEAEYRRALAIQEKTLGVDHPYAAATAYNLAEHLFEHGRATEALPLAERAWNRHQRDDIVASTRAASAFLVARVRVASLRDRVVREEARGLAEQALSIWVAEGDEDAAAAVRKWLGS